MDKIVTWIFGAVFAALLTLAVLVIGAMVYMSASDDYTCEKTGRQVLVMMPAGKVMVPTIHDETICKRVEK